MLRDSLLLPNNLKRSEPVSKSSERATDKATKKNKLPPLTTKQEKFVKEYVKGQLANPTEPQYKAALKTYDIDKEKTPKARYEIANAISNENLKKPSITFAIEKALKKHDITIDSAIKPIKDGLEAKRVIGSTDTGEVIETIDHNTRLKASSMALKLMGADKKDQAPSVQFNFKGGTANFDIGKYKR